MTSLDLYEVLLTCNDYITNPTKKGNIEEFNRLIEALVIRPRLSLVQRQSVLLKTLIDIRADETFSVADLSKSLEISLTFNGLLAYTNIDPDFAHSFKDADMYDLLWLSGFCDIILEKCQKDFERLEKQVYAMISFDNLRVMLESLSVLDTSNVEELTRAFTEFTFQAQPETIKNLAEIARFSDPITKELNDALRDKAYTTLSKSSDDTKEDQD